MKIIRPTAVLDEAGGFSRASTATYYDSTGSLQIAAINIPRISYNPSTLAHIGLLIEASATNLLLNSALGTNQNVSIPSAPVPYTLSFIGTGTIGLSGAYTASIVGTGINNITILTFTPVIGNLTLIITGSIKNIQLEIGSTSTSYIPTTSTTVTRSADIVTGTGLVYSNLVEGGGTLLTKPEILTTQSLTVVNSSYVISFTGTGTITLSGASTVSLIGTSNTVRVTKAFIPVTGTLTLTVTGSVKLAQLELGTVANAYRNETLWAATTSYTIGQQVYRANTHIIYENVIAGVDSNLPESNPARWLVVGPTNKWAIFDEQVGTSSANLYEITYLIKPGRLNSLAFLETEASYVSISLVANNEIVYKYDSDLNSGNNVANWYDYFYESIYQVSSASLTEILTESLVNIPAYGEGVLAVTFKSANIASCGVLVIGLSSNLGSTQNTPSLGIVDYSRKDADVFGNSTVIKRKYSRRFNATSMFKSSEVDNIYNILSTYRSTPLVWLGTDNLYSSLIVYGFYKDFEITIDNILYSSCSIQIEGLT